MTSKEVANLIECSYETISRKTKKAYEKNLNSIELKGFTFTFELTTNSNGKAYSYTQVEDNKKPKKRKVNASKIVISELPEIINLDKPTIEEKKEIINFYKTHNASLKAIAQAYNTVFNYKYNVMSLERKFRRWNDSFKANGTVALEDKRGGNKVSKIDRELFLKSIIKNSNLYTYFSRYCAYYCMKHDLPIDIYNPTSNISYSGYKNYFHAHKADLEVQMLLKGKDFASDMIPTFNSAKYVDYPNEQWQIDATTIDVQAKIPVINGEPDYFTTQKSDEYILKRFTLVGIVDVFSGARVYELFHTGNSYSDVRLLRKAINTLGLPEVIKGDNGKDYVSNHFQSVLGHLGITYFAATPYKGAEKGKIERGFRTLQHNHLFENLAGFTGHSTAQKIIIENQATSKSERRGLPTTLKEEMMWWWELSACIDGIIKHKFKEEFDAHDVELNIPDNLDKKLGNRKEKVINKNGIAHNKTYYRSVDLWKVAQIKDKVLMIEDIDDMNKVYALVGDTYIELISDELFDISVDEAKEIKKNYKKKVNKKVKDIAKSGNDDFTKLQEISKIQHMSKAEFERANVDKKTKNNTPKNDKSTLVPSSSEPELSEFIRSVS